MPNKRVIHQVRGILAEEEIFFRVGPSGTTFLVPVPHGSAAVLIDFSAWGRDQTMISLQAEVLVNIELTETNRNEVLEHVNALNQTSLFGRFYLDADRSTIVLEYDLLGDELESDELMNALYTIGVIADQTDDELMHALGTGERASEVLARTGALPESPSGEPWLDPRPAVRQP